MAVVAVEEAALLVAVRRVIGGVEVQHDLLRRRVVAGQELFDQHLVQTHNRTACNAVLQPAERRGTRERPVFVRLAAGGQLQRRVAA